MTKNVWHGTSWLFNEMLAFPAICLLNVIHCRDLILERNTYQWHNPRKWNLLQLQSLTRRLILISYVNVLLVFLCIFFSLTVKTFPFLAFSYLPWSSQFIFVHFIFPFSTLPSNPHLPLSLPQMEESGSPRFRKLHFPVGLWINSPRKHFAKLGARWPSAASVKSVFWTFSYSLDQWQIRVSLIK